MLSLTQRIVAVIVADEMDTLLKLDVSVALPSEMEEYQNPPVYSEPSIYCEPACRPCTPRHGLLRGLFRR